jgi:hypothetical protein
VRSSAVKVARLFVDDNLFALAIAVWLAAIGAVRVLHLGSPLAQALGLFAGLSFVLIASAARAARRA